MTVRRIFANGQWMRREMSDADYARMLQGQREFEQVKGAALQAAIKAIQAHHDDASTLVIRYSLLMNSENRLPAVLELIEQAPSSIFWPTFFTVWCSCDDTWRHRKKLLIALRRQRKAALPIAFMSDADRIWLDSLPDPIPVFRGCSRARAKGLAWTTDKHIAAGFARGHRSISVADAVVVAAMTPKSAVFAAITERKEQELVLYPARCHILSMHKVE